MQGSEPDFPESNNIKAKTKRIENEARRIKSGVPGIRPLIFGNGKVLICEDERGTIRDVYFPYVGLENHGNSIRVGICDLDSLYCSWLENWNIRQRYKSEFETEFCNRILDISASSEKEDFTEKGTNGEPKTGNKKAPEACREVISNIGETSF